MALTSLILKDFRCFPSHTFEAHPRITLIEGPNGSGKSSLLEAIHLAGTLRSFRTAQPRELIRDGADACSVRASFTGPTDEEVFVAYSGRERVAKRNGIVLTQRHELFDIARVIAVTEADLAIVQGFPEMRRALLDQALVSEDPTRCTLLRRYYQMVRQRGAVIMSGRLGEQYALWTEQLALETIELRALRQQMLVRMRSSLRTLLETHEVHLGITTFDAQYHAADSPEDWEPSRLGPRELHARRALVGAHLDEIEFIIDDKRARRYASRGFQKLLTILLKLSQLHHATGERILLLDDFITDFDEQRIAAAMALVMTTDAQIIVTAPHHTTLTLRDTIRAQSGTIVSLP